MSSAEAGLGPLEALREFAEGRADDDYAPSFKMVVLAILELAEWCARLSERP